MQIEATENIELSRLYADDPAAYGQLTVWNSGDDIAWCADVRPGLDAAQRKRFEEWAANAMEALLETHDPERNGWYPSSTGSECWYLTARERLLMPDL